MKFIILTIFLSFFNFVYSQQIEKRIEFTLDSSYYDKSFTKSDEVKLESKILKTNIIDTSTQKIIAEFLRLTDTAYLFRKFDFLGNVETEGKVILSQKVLESYKSPFYDSLGRFVKFKLIKIYNFTKVGKWYEIETNSIYRQGKYNNSIKTGTWVYFKKRSKIISIEEKKELYVGGEIAHSFRSNLFEIDDSDKIKTLLGRWNLDMDIIKISPDSILQFSKISRIESHNSKCYLNFISQDLCELYVRSGMHHGSRTYSCQVEILQKKILVYIPQLNSRLEINYLSLNNLMGKFLTKE